MLEHARLTSWHTDRKRVALDGLKFDDISAVRLRAIASLTDRA